MTPGKGDVLLAEGDPEVSEDAERLIEEFRRQLDLGMWAAVPHEGPGGHREATMVRDFSEIPLTAERVIFFPRAAGGSPRFVKDHERDRLAEQRARELLRTTAGAEALEMYERLGFVSLENEAGEYGYLIYPQRPLVGYDARSGEPLSEYCVRFRDGSEPEAGERLPDADDVLAKWLALRIDEEHTLAAANVHPLGRQLDPAMVRRDLAALWRWEPTA